jgi:hypothetical protein
MSKDEFACAYGEKDEEFYLILDGIVQINVPDSLTKF